MKRRSDEIVTLDVFIYHQLALNEVYCALKYRPAPLNTKVEKWSTFSQPIDRDRSLIPDGYAELVTGSRVTPAFVELDLGHESLTTWKAKIEKYVRYALSGSFEERFQHPTFRVLVVTSSDRRQQSLRKATAATTDRIFWFATLDSIKQKGPCAPIWLRPTGEQGPIPLI